MEIQEATALDINALVKFGKYFHDISDYGKFQAYEEKGLAKNLYDILNNSNSKIWIAWDKNELAGTIMGMLVHNFYDPSQVMADCGAIAVLPKYGRKHIGKKLRNIFEKWAKDNDANIIVYSGYSRKFITAMKREGYTQTEVTLMKLVE